jgi:hypothetical protein
MKGWCKEQIILSMLTRSGVQDDVYIVLLQTLGAKAHVSLINLLMTASVFLHYMSKPSAWTFLIDYKSSRPFEN